MKLSKVLSLSTSNSGGVKMSDNHFVQNFDDQTISIVPKM
jgi:hypothetical protein